MNMNLLLRNGIIFFLIIAFLAAGTALGQEPQTTVGDTTMQRASVRKSELEGPITYEAQIIDNFMNERKTVLLGRAKVSYLNMTLKAARIVVDWDKDLMTAEGILDSVWVRNEDSDDSVKVAKLIETPEFTEAGDVLAGEVMVFNFRTQKGRVLRGRTTYQDGFYDGTTLKMVQSGTLNVGDACFTTCDKEDDPHFHFRAKKMKIEVNKKVIAKPIVMYIGKIPVMALPFIYFPIQKGRQSGLLLPRYGESTYEGRYLRGLGYYWAPSDYFDIQGTVDYFEQSGFLFRGDFRYKLRYKFEGRISGSWTRKDFDISGRKERVWDLTVNHRQVITPTINLAVSGRFVSSSDIYKELSENVESRLQQEIRSNAKLTKRWGRSGLIGISLNQTRRLDTDQVTETLPQITISNNWQNIIPKPKTTSGQERQTRWYESFRMPYRFNFLGEDKRSFISQDKRYAIWRKL